MFYNKKFMLEVVECLKKTKLKKYITVDENSAKIIIRTENTTLEIFEYGDLFYRENYVKILSKFNNIEHYNLIPAFKKSGFTEHYQGVGMKIEQDFMPQEKWLSMLKNNVLRLHRENEQIINEG